MTLLETHQWTVATGGVRSVGINECVTPAVIAGIILWAALAVALYFLLAS